MKEIEYLCFSCQLYKNAEKYRKHYPIEKNPYPIITPSLNMCYGYQCIKCFLYQPIIKQH